MPSTSNLNLNSPQSSDDEVLVKVENVSKKFCRDLKKSLWYGVCDIAGELLPFGKSVVEDESLSLSQNPDPELPTSTGEDQAENNFNLNPQLKLSKYPQLKLSKYPQLKLSKNPQPKLSKNSQLKLSQNSQDLRPEEFWAVNNVSFELKRGECLGLIGRNGAGKTTLLKMLNGLIKPDSGRITMKGRVGALIALGAGFNPILTGRENIYVNGSVLGLTKKEIDAKFDEIVDFSGIEEFIDTPVRSYSSGMQVRLGFAVASSLNPNVLLVDEVLAVGDSAFRMKCYRRIMGTLRSGCSVILVSHNMLDIERVCKRGIVLLNGKIYFDGNVSDSINQYYSSQQAVSVASGNQHICIQARISSGHENSRYILNNGESLTIEVNIQSETQYPKCSLFLRIDTSSGEIFGGKSCVADNKWIAVNKGKNHYTCIINNLNLVQGIYKLFVGLYGETEASLIAQNESALEFCVESPKANRFGQGYVGPALLNIDFK